LQRAGSRSTPTGTLKRTAAEVDTKEGIMLGTEQRLNEVVPD